jgi:hypothetical protein
MKHGWQEILVISFLLRDSIIGIYLQATPRDILQFYNSTIGFLNDFLKCFFLGFFFINKLMFMDFTGS